MYSSHYGKLRMPFNHYSHPKHVAANPIAEPKQGSKGGPR